MITRQDGNEMKEYGTNEIKGTKDEEHTLRGLSCIGSRNITRRRIERKWNLLIKC